MAPKSLRVVLLAAAAAVPLLGQGCSSSSDNTTGPSPVIAMTATSSGDGQTAQVGTALPSPLRVVVTLNGTPQVGTTVSWAAQGTGASVAPTSSTTDVNGVTTTTWTLGSAAGTQHATATLAGAGGSPVTFSATASAAPVPLIGKANSSGDAQSGAAGAALPNPLRVVVTLSGNPVQGDTVTWAAGAGSGSVAPTKSATDVNGIATTTWTLGATGGAQGATATLAGATGSPVSFTATAIVPVIAKAASASGDAQTGPVAATLADSLRVVVTFNGAAQAGDTVVWAAVGTGAAVNPLKSVTDASGLAATTWTLGQTAGPQSATASLANATGSPVGFTATGTAGPATQIAVSSGDAQRALLNTAFGSPLAVKISDQFGNGVAGDTVTWASVLGLTVAAPLKTASGASGLAQTSLTAGGTAGTDTITATATGLTGSPVRFTAAVTAATLTDSVTVGSGITFTSRRNGTSNPAVDTIAVGGTMTWVWAGGTHGIQSTGSPAFTGQSTSQTSGTFAVTFSAAGTYTYDCLVHGNLMTGRIVVQ